MNTDRLDVDRLLPNRPPVRIIRVMEPMHDDPMHVNRRWPPSNGADGRLRVAWDAARPVPEDYGLTPEDLRIRYAPGRAGALLALATTVGSAGLQALDGARHADPWILGAIGGLLYGALIGGFAGLGLLALVHWCDPLLGWAWPAYARLRRYREALAVARSAEEGDT